MECQNYYCYYCKKHRRYNVLPPRRIVFVSIKFVFFAKKWTEAKKKNSIHWYPTKIMIVTRYLDTVCCHVQIFLHVFCLFVLFCTFNVLDLLFCILYFVYGGCFIVKPLVGHSFSACLGIVRHSTILLVLASVEILYCKRSGNF